MTADRLLDLVCVSYLADARVMNVDTYPLPDSGAVVDASAASLAGDGPLTAITAAHLGLSTGLITNSVGDDLAGHRLQHWLDQCSVRHRARAAAGTVTPHLTVITDRHTRTWFAALGHAYADLLTADLTPLAHARLAYIDCYRVIADAAARAVAAADIPLLLNLGGDRPNPALNAAAAGKQVLAVQTSIDESDVGAAGDVADELYRRFTPHAAIVTCGRHGALARTRQHRHHSSAPMAVIEHTHGAGAAFSAGYAHALLAGADVPEALAAGCAAGTRHCSSPAALIPPSLPADLFTTA